jgi:dTDP-4-dehydrorhamnose reductase
VILRTSWVYAAHGHNFVKTMLRLAAESSRIRVVADQRGTPTAAADIATAIATITERIVASNSDDRFFGTFHFAADGETSWYGLAERIFDIQKEMLGWRPTCEPIGTADFPLPARRPAYSVLDCSRTEGIFGIVRPKWEDSLDPIATELIADRSQSLQPLSRVRQ